MSQSSPLSLPLIATPENRGDDSTSDARLINGYAERTAMGELWCYKRPGYTLQDSVATAGKVAAGIFAWDGAIYSIFGDSFYKDGVFVGTVNDSSTLGYTFTITQGATPQLFFRNRTNAYVYDSGGGLVAVSDGDYPTTTVPGCVNLDGTVYVMTPEGYILGSDLNDATNWDPLNSLRVQIEPSQGRAIAKQLSYVIAFKENSTEVFFDAQNAAGSPLGRVEGANFNFGCHLSRSVVDIDGALYWIGHSAIGEVNVMKMENLKHEIISTPAVERLLQGYDPNAVYGTGFYTGGHKFYAITSVSSNFTLVYDVREKIWAQWTDVDGNYFPLVFSARDRNFPPVTQGILDGNIYNLNSEVYTDADEDFTWELITPVWDGGSRLGKMVNILEIKSDQKSAGTLDIRFSDDDYQTWSSWRTVDLSYERPMLDQMGTFRRRAHHFRHTGDVPFRVKAVDLHVDLCTL